MPPETRRYARIKLSTTRRSSVGSLARICSPVGSGLDPCRTSATALPSTNPRFSLWRVVVVKEAWQSADPTWCVVAPASSAIECRPRRLWGTNLGDTPLPVGKIGLSPARDRRTVRTVLGRARSLVGRTPRWLGGRTAPLDLRPPLRYGNRTHSA